MAFGDCFYLPVVKKIAVLTLGHIYKSVGGPVRVKSVSLPDSYAGGENNFTDIKIVGCKIVHGYPSPYKVNSRKIICFDMYNLFVLSVYKTAEFYIIKAMEVF